jgi:PAS domain S-box-containing protein
MVVKNMMRPRSADQFTHREGEAAEAASDIATFGETLDALCLLVEEQSAGIMTGVLMLDGHGRHWQAIAGPSMARVWQLTTSSQAITPTSGAAGAAVHRRAQVIVSDVATDALYEENRRAMLDAGVRACWATPFFAQQGRLLGIVIMHCPDPRGPTDTELRVIDRLAHLAGISVGRKLNRDVVEASEQRWRSLFESSAFGIAITDQSGKLVATNRAYQELSGYSEEELLEMHHLELTVEEDLDVTLELRRCLHAGELRETRVEKRYRCKDGRVRWVRVTTSILPSAPGSPYFLLGIAEDIHDRKRAEHELRRSEANLAEGQRLSRTGSWACHPSGLLFWSQETFRIAGFDPVAGPPTLLQLRDRIHPDDLAQFDAHLHDALDTHGQIRSEFRILQPGGAVKHIDCIGHPVMSETGEFVEYVGTIMDITESKRIEQQLNASLEQARALAARLLQAQDGERRRIARALHETTEQDLAALETSLGALQRRSACSIERDHDLLAESAMLARHSLKDVRTLSYLLQPPPLDEAGLCPALRQYVSGYAERSGMETELCVEPELGRLSSDVETTLLRIVQESLINIHRHAHSPRATIRLLTDYEQLVLEIRDSGRGMHHGATCRSSVQDAVVGVGIASMRERITQLGGQLEIESSHRGTTVRATLPISALAPKPHR